MKNGHKQEAVTVAVACWIICMVLIGWSVAVQETGPQGHFKMQDLRGAAKYQALQGLQGK